MAGSPRRKPGRMAAHIEPFREWLRSAGYTPGSTRGLLMVMGQLGRWMQANVDGGERLAVTDLDAFVGWLRSRFSNRAPRLRSTGPLIAYLLDAGVLEPLAVPPPGDVDVVIDAFKRWMINERGLAAGTV